MEQIVMTGAAKQIDWAQQIRATKAKELEKWRQYMLGMAAKETRVAPEAVAARVAEYERLIVKVLAHSAAIYWIDRRSFDARRLVDLEAANA
jgi:hypothetical protein